MAKIRGWKNLTSRERKKVLRRVQREYFGINMKGAEFFYNKHGMPTKKGLIRKKLRRIGV